MKARCDNDMRQADRPKIRQKAVVDIALVADQVSERQSGC